MDFLILFIFFGSISAFSVWYFRIISGNDKKLISQIDKLRSRLAKDSPSEFFPLTTQDVPGPGGHATGLTTFEIRTIIDFNAADATWTTYVLTPAGIQSTHTIRANELVIKLPRLAVDLKVGLYITPNVGFISPRYLLPSEVSTLNPSRKGQEEIDQLIEAFRSMGATIQEE